MRNNMHWRAGYKAYDQGLAPSACNHDPESVEYAFWHEGWTTAQEDDTPVDSLPEWDYSSEYCDGCAELGLTTCSCEPDGEEEQCNNCGEPLPFGGDICDECEEEDYNTFNNID